MSPTNDEHTKAENVGPEQQTNVITMIGYYP